MVVFWGAIYSFFMYRFFNLLLQRDAEIEYALVAYPSSLFTKLKPFNGLELRWYLRNNKIWKSLELDDRTDLLNQAYELSLVLSDCSDHEKTYLRKLLPVLSHTMIGKIKNANLDEVFSGRERSMIFRLMLSGMSFEKARKLSREKTIDKIERKVKINRLIKWFLKPFYWVYERLSQLIWLKKKFYEMCPFVMREGKIDMYN
jgi:hypothetical protein